MDTGSIIAIGIAGGSLAVSGFSALLAYKANQRADRLERRTFQANPIVTSRGKSGSGSETYYGFDVSNDGPATITYVNLWIADHAGDPISTGDAKGLVLKVGGFVPLVVKMVNPERQGRVVWLQWEDPEGPHKRQFPDVYVEP